MDPSMPGLDVRLAELAALRAPHAHRWEGVTETITLAGVTHTVAITGAVVPATAGMVSVWTSTCTCTGQTLCDGWSGHTAITEATIRHLRWHATGERVCAEALCGAELVDRGGAYCEDCDSGA